MRAGSLAVGMNMSRPAPHGLDFGSIDVNRSGTLNGRRTAAAGSGMMSDAFERPNTAMSHSVFDLHHQQQLHQQQQQHQHQQHQHQLQANANNGFGTSPMFCPTNGQPLQQAHLPGGNCMSCSQQQLNWNATGQPPLQPHGYAASAWDMNSAHQLNGSNMSLNILPAGHYPPRGPLHAAGGPPPAWFNGWAPPPPGMYPYPYPYPAG